MDVEVDVIISLPAKHENTIQNEKTCRDDTESTTSLESVPLEVLGDVLQIDLQVLEFVGEHSCGQKDDCSKHEVYDGVEYVFFVDADIKE